MKPHILVDLDGTLAEYKGYRGPEHIGKPIPAMVERIHKWIETGLVVKIFTARVAHGKAETERARYYIQKWLEHHDLPPMEITCIKNYAAVEIYDDRAVQVEFNTGRLLGESTMKHRRLLK